MFDTPYQTTPCLRFSHEKAAKFIREMEIHEELLPAIGSTQGVMMVPPGKKDPLPFLQPITPNQIKALQAPAVIDGRSLLRADGTPAKTDQYNHAVLTADLSVMWCNKGKPFRKDMLDLGEFPAKVFISWLGGAITKRLGLDLGQGQSVRLLTAVYYIQLFEPLSEKPTTEEVDRLLTRTARYIPAIDYLTIAGVLGEVPRLEKLQDLLDWIVKHLDSPRTEDLNISLVYTALGYTFGPPHREAVAIAIEYPPMFIAWMYKLCLARSYTREDLGKVIDMYRGKDSDKEFVKDVQHLIKRS